MTKVAWRKCAQTEDLSDTEKAKFYRVRANVVRAVHKQNLAASSANANMKYLDNPSLVQKIELSTEDIDELAREAYDTGTMPILDGAKITLSKLPVSGDLPC